MTTGKQDPDQPDSITVIRRACHHIVVALTDLDIANPDAKTLTRQMRATVDVLLNSASELKQFNKQRKV